MSYPTGMMRPGESSAQKLLARQGMQRVPTPKLELFVLRNFLSEPECSALIERIDAKRRPSTLANFNGDENFRTRACRHLSQTRVQTRWRPARKLRAVFS